MDGVSWPNANATLRTPGTIALGQRLATTFALVAGNAWMIHACVINCIQELIAVNQGAPMIAVVAGTAYVAFAIANQGSKVLLAKRN